MQSMLVGIVGFARKIKFGNMIGQNSTLVSWFLLKLAADILKARGASNGVLGSPGCLTQ